MSEAKTGRRPRTDDASFTCNLKDTPKCRLADQRVTVPETLCGPHERSVWTYYRQPFLQGADTGPEVHHVKKYWGAS
jgi:hypothetical protein